MKKSWADIYRNYRHLIHLGILFLVVVAESLSIAGHAFHIDEPVFIRVATQIKEHFWDPYGFSYNWGETSRPAHHFIASPPLFGYLLFLVTRGQTFPSEFFTHAALMPLGLIAVWSFYNLLRRETLSPELSLFGSLLFGVSPTFVISNNLAMPDMACVSFALLSLETARRGWQYRSIPWLLFSGLCLGISLLSRFNATPLLACFVLFGYRERSDFRAWWPSLIGGGVCLAWVLWSRHLYGDNQLHTLLQSEYLRLDNLLERFLAMCSHLTLSTFLPLFAIMIFLSKPKLTPLLLTGAIFVVILILDPRTVPGFRYLPDSLFVLPGLFCLVFLLSAPGRLQVWPYKLWALGCLAIPMVYIFFASKYLLLVQPALITLLLRRHGEIPIKALKLGFSCLALIFSFSLSVAFSDFQLAETYRQAAIHFQRFAEQNSSSRIWFRGHWGLHYYMEKIGGTALETNAEGEKLLKKGDTLVTATYPAPVWISDNLKARLSRIKSLTFPLDFPIRTMNKPSRAGFYASSFGNLPLAVSRHPLEIFHFYRVKSDAAEPTK